MANKEINEVKENEKVKPIMIHDKEDNVDYTLEFDLESVKFAEARGFNPDKIGQQLAIGTEELFYYAFRMHHKNVSREKTNHILWDDDKLGGIGNLPEGFLERLVMLYYEPLTAVKSAEETGKNARMTVEM